MYIVWYVNALEAKLVSPVTMVTLLVLSVHKDFQHRDKDKSEVLKIIYTMKSYETYYTYFNIDCRYLIKSVLQTSLLGILRFL